MITFIPAWDQGSIDNISSDDLMSKIRTFVGNEDDYKVLTINYMPFLRYFVHRYDLLESNYWNLFDELQSVPRSLEQKQLEISDLNLRNITSYAYGPFAITAFSGNDVSAVIRTGEGGQISQVEHFEDDKLVTTDFYDDRGFLSSYRVHRNGELEYTMYLDYQGDWIFKVFNKDQMVFVNPENNHGLTAMIYKSIQEVQAEVLNKKMKQLAGKSAFVFSINNENYNFILNNEYLSQTALSFFSNRLDFSSIPNESIAQLIEKSKACLVDTEANYQQLVTRNSENKGKIVKLSPFDTRFEFGISQTLREEIIFFDSRFISKEQTKLYMKTFFKFIMNEQNKNDEEYQREIQVTIRCNNTDEQATLDIIRSIVKEEFPEDYETIYQLLEETGEENSITKTMREELIPNLLNILKVLMSFSVQVINRDEDLFKVLNKARIIVDLSNNPDLFTQIAGISAGIPQLNLVKTDYVDHGENGLILDKNQDLEAGLKYYLNEMEKWIRAQAYSAKQVKEYSGDALKEYLLQVMGEEQYGR